MRLVRQKPNGCGAACVAMLAGVPLHVAERAVGKTRKTHTRDLRRGLREFGFRPGTRLRRLPPVTPTSWKFPPPMTVVKVRWRGTRETHWVVHDRSGRIACPAVGWTDVLELHLRGGELLSYLPVGGALARTA